MGNKVNNKEKNNNKKIKYRAEIRPEIDKWKKYKNIKMYKRRISWDLK